MSLKPNIKNYKGNLVTIRIFILSITVKSMPLGNKVECCKCKENSSVLWHAVEEDKFQCNACFDHALALKLSTDEENIRNSTVTERVKITIRKSPRSTRSYKTRLNPNAVPKTLTPKGRGRRYIFKKNPVKAPASSSEIISCSITFHEGTYLKAGDIVAIRDHEGDIYYAQIRGLMMDQYCEKSGVITWLVPTERTDLSKAFDPLTFTYGPEEDIPRSLDCMEFVMHAPSDYFKPNNSPYPPINQMPSENGFIWTKLTAGTKYLQK